MIDPTKLQGRDLVLYNNGFADGRLAGIDTERQRIAGGMLDRITAIERLKQSALEDAKTQRDEYVGEFWKHVAARHEKTIAETHAILDAVVQRTSKDEAAHAVGG